MKIAENYKKIKNSVPKQVIIVVAAKTRTKKEVEELIDVGCTDIGENYVQEANEIYSELGEKAKKVKWHLIGHLQKNKVNQALKIFDVFQTIDSFELAEAISKRADMEIEIYIEVNSGREEQKSGVFPEKVISLIKEISELKNIKVNGLMTMGPFSGNPEDARPYFKETKKLFDEIKDLKVLSMGMSNSYKIAIEEGSNMIRLGTCIFGEREA